MNVADIMKTNPKSLSPEASIQAAAQLMRDTDFDAVPIVDRLGALVGIVTEHDLVVTAVAKGLSHNTPLSACMTAKPETISRDTTIDQAMMLMSSKQIPYLPIIENGRLAGMITLADIVTNFYLNGDEGDLDDEEEDADIEDFGRSPAHTYDLRA